MRTTIAIDDDLLDEVKRRAVESRKTVSAVIEESVRAAFALVDETDEVFDVHPVRTGGYQPGVDITNNAALLDIMDGKQ